MNSAYRPSSGVTLTPFAIFQRVAQQQWRIIIVRNTNTKSTPWIAQGYPPKPKALEGLNTSHKTGKVTVRNESERQFARREGFYVIDNDGIARRNPDEALQKRFPFGTNEMNEPGQVIDPQQQRAIVGDYDLMAVIDPAAKGRTIALAYSYGKRVDNCTNPDVTRVINELNSQMDQKRVMHGPQDLYGSFKGPCTAFLTSGLTYELSTEQAVRLFCSVDACNCGTKGHRLRAFSHVFEIQRRKTSQSGSSSHHGGGLQIVEGRFSSVRPYLDPIRKRVEGRRQQT